MASNVVITHDSTDDEEQHKEVYARFGIAGYWAQCVEASLGIFFLLHERVNCTTLIMQDLDAMEASRQKQTLGRLIKNFRNYVDVDAGGEELLKRALEKRNFLMHRYFQDRSVHFISKGGRCQMIDELTEITSDLQYADKVIVVVYRCLDRELGITDDVIDRGFAELQVEAELLYPTPTPAHTPSASRTDGTAPPSDSLESAS